MEEVTVKESCKVMLDGIHVGIRCDLNEGLGHGKEGESIWDVLKKHLTDEGKCREGKELEVTLNDDCIPKLKRYIYVSLKKSRKGDWFLNIRTNPCSLFTGENVYGSVNNTPRQIRDIFELVIDFLEREGVAVEKLRARIRKGDITVSSLSFASYSKQTPGINGLFNMWRAFMISYVWKRDERGEPYPLTLANALGIVRDDVEDYATSIGFNIYRYNLMGRNKSAAERGNKWMHACLYSKEAEIAGDDPDAVRDEYIHDRLRLDIQVTNYYLSREFTGARTLKEIFVGMKKKYGT